MFGRYMLRAVLALSLSALVSVSAFAQYPDGGSTGTGSGGYGANGAAIGAGVAAAAGAGILFLVLHNRGSLVGCVEAATEGTKLMNEKDKKTYALLSDAGDLKPGERVELKGKKVKDKSGKLSFQVTKMAKNYGPCKQ